MSLTSNELPDWKQLVLNRKEQLGSLQKVADELGYSRTSLSLALRDKYIDAVGALARAARAAMMTKSKAMENRGEIRKQAREELLREQDANLQKAAASQGMGEEQIQFWREKVLGIK